MASDRQGGETVIASYYGYRADGIAVFYQAVGKVTDGKTFNANLIEYKGGTALGGAVMDATEAKIIGPIQAVFNTETSGNVTLPGSEPKPFSRYVYEDQRIRLNNNFQVTWINLSSASNPIKQFPMYFQVNENELVVSYNDPNDGDQCSFHGDLKPDGLGFKSSGSISCGTILGVGIPRNDRIEHLKVDEHGILTGTLHSYYNQPDSSVKTTLLGMCFVYSDAIPMPAPAMNHCGASRLGLTAAPE